MRPALAALAETVQQSGFGLWASQSALAYPLANLVHLLGLVMLVGGIGLVDLRFAGAFRSLSPAALSRALTPVALAGFALMAMSGPVLFAADAVAVASSPFFQWKLVLIAAAVTNAVAFRLIWRRRIADWADNPPAMGRLMAAASLLLWLAVGTCGRMIAYS